MRIRFLFAGMLALGLAGCARDLPASAVQPCWADRISNTNGQQIGLQSGLAYQAYPGPHLPLSLWAPLDKVSVCPLGGDAVEITNLSQTRLSPQSQSVKAVRFYPSNTGGI